jgi:hypothetical protein
MVNKSKNNQQKSRLHNIIDKNNTKMLITVSGAVFVVVFCLVASRTLINQSFYQNDVISKKKTALTTLENNIDSASDLEASYLSFATEPVNVIGGNPAGDGPKDGDNAKIVLDALPAVLDYPGLSSSIEKILVGGGYAITSIGGSEDTAVSAVAATEETPVVADSAPVQIPYPIVTSSSPELALSLLQTLEKSIRPFNISSLKIEGNGNNLGLTVSMFTYYQPEKTLQITKEVVQ